MKYTDEINGVLYAYISLFHEGHIPGAPLLLKNQTVESFEFLDNREGLIYKTRSDSKKILYKDLLNDTDLNFKDLFKTYWKFLYGEKGENQMYNEYIDLLVKEL